MKNLFKKTMLFAAAAMAFVSCENDTTDVNTLPGIDVTVNATVEGTKSHFGDYNATDKTYPTLWDGTEEWYVALNNQCLLANNDNGELTFNDDKSGARVEMTFDNVEASNAYTLCAVSPSTAYAQRYSEGNYLGFNINSAQTPSTTSCDPLAQILVAKSETMTEPSFDVTFKHATAYANFSFTDLNLNGATVQSVTVESEVPFVGRFDYKLTDNSIAANAATSTITLNTTTTENLWLACAPVDLQGKKLTFTIITDKGPLTKEVTMPTGKGEFKSGVVAKFNVSMAGIEFEESVKYELVTDASELAVGDEIIIASSSAAKALSTTQNNNNRAATDVTKQDKYIVDPSNEVQIITLEAGTKANTFAFKVGEKYLYAGSSSQNRLYSGTTKNDNASWAISITSSGVATVTAQGNNTRNIMQYNGAQASALIFNCYGNTTTTGCTLLSIYKLPSTKPVIAAAGATAPIVGGEGQTATYTLKNIATDDIEVASFNGNITEATKSAEGTITYNISANTNKGAKVSNIVLSSPSTGATATISVTQAAPVFTVTPASLTFEATANSTAKFKVTSTYAATIEVSDETKWSVSPATVEAGVETEITVTARTANEGEEAVTGTVTVTRTGSVSEEVSLSQAAASTGGGDEPEPVTVTMSTFTTISGSMDSVISYTSAKGDGTSNPAIYDNEIRLYQNSNGTGGGYITITAAAGHKISSVTIGSSMATSVAHTIDNGTTKSATSSLAKNGKHTITEEAQSVTIYCMGTSSKSRLYVNYLSVTYK